MKNTGKKLLTSLRRAVLRLDEETINKVAELRVQKEDKTGRSDDSVSGDHIDDYQWSGPVYYNFYVSE